jgi:hypothetical protein
VSAALSAFAVPDRASNPATRFTPLGRAAAAATLLIGATFQVLAFALMPDFAKTVDRLQWIADNPTQAAASKTFDLLAVPFLLGGVIVYVLLSRERSPRFAWAGGILLGLGMCGLMAVQGFETLQLELVRDGRFDLHALADTVDNVSSAPAIAMGLLFIGGAALGILVTSIALWRSRAVPRAIPVLLVAFFLVDVAASQPLIAHVIALIAAAWIAWTILSAPRAAGG